MDRQDIANGYVPEPAKPAPPPPASPPPASKPQPSPPTPKPPAEEQLVWIPEEPNPFTPRKEVEEFLTKMREYPQDNSMVQGAIERAKEVLRERDEDLETAALVDGPPPPRKTWLKGP